MAEMKTNLVSEGDGVAIGRFLPLHGQGEAAGPVYLRIKRFLDLLIVYMTLPIWLTLLLMIWLAIKLESPRSTAFFVQERTGFLGERFKMIKFRTMVPNADALKEQLRHLNEQQWPDFKIANDPRVTRVGRYIRRLHLDELPQILNVIRGEMTLVGPRPTSYRPETYEETYGARLMVPPGLTGLWQIQQDTAPGFEDHMRLDVEYVRSMCFSTDAKVLFLTVLKLVTGRFKV